MTRLLNLNGAALLALAAMLLVATWPFFATFNLASLIGGLCVAVAMRSWQWHHPTTVALPDQRLRSEINLSSIPVRDDAGGLLFALGSMAILLGLAELRAFMIGSLLCATVLAFALIAWRRHAPATRQS